MISILKGNVVNPEKIKGKSAYEIAVAKGYTGTEEEWLASLDAYGRAKEAGFIGTEEEFYQKLADLNITSTSDSVYVTPQMFGAKGDGVTDDTAAIQAALDRSSLVCIPDGTYLINGTNSGWGHMNEGGIFPRSNQTIVLSKNATLKVKSNNNGFYNIVNIVDVENVHIIGGKVQGIKTTPTSANYGSEFGIGVNILGASNVTIENMEIFDCWGDSIGIGYTGNTQSHNTKVINCVLHDSRRQGISITGATNAVIRDCEIYNISGTSPQFGIDIEPDGTGIASDITIDSCYIHDNTGGSIVTASGNETVNSISNVNITNCTLDVACLIAGSNINMDNCFIKDARMCTANTARCSNSTINFVFLSGGNCIFDNCDMVFANRDYAIIISDGGYPTKKAKMICHNCRISTDDTVYHFILAEKIDFYDGLCAELIKFIDCTIDFGAICTFNADFLGTQELRIENCKVVFNKEKYDLIATNGVGENRLIMSNTEIECIGDMRYMFITGETNVMHIEVSNCKLPNAQDFMYCYDGASGSVRLFNNNLSKTNIIGPGADGYERTIINSFVTEMPSDYVTDEELSKKGYLTSVPSEYITETELANKGYLTGIPSEYVTESELNQKGYLTLSTLPKYNGGVS